MKTIISVIFFILISAVSVSGFEHPVEEPEETEEMEMEEESLSEEEMPPMPIPEEAMNTRVQGEESD